MPMIYGDVYSKLNMLYYLVSHFVKSDINWNQAKGNHIWHSSHKNDMNILIVYIIAIHFLNSKCPIKINLNKKLVLLE